MKQRSDSGEPASEPANSLQLPNTNRFKLKAQTAKKDLLDQQNQQDQHPADNKEKAKKDLLDRPPDRQDRDPVEAKENYHWLNSYFLVTTHRETVISSTFKDTVQRDE